MNATKERPQFARPGHDPRMVVGRGALVSLLIVIVGVALLGRATDLALNRYVLPRCVHAYTLRHPGDSLQVRRMAFQWWRSTVVCKGVSLVASNHAAACSAQTLSLAGVPWISLALGERRPSVLLQQAVAHATGVSMEFPRAGYRLRCREFSGAVSTSSVAIRDLELRPLVSDQEFFAARPYRRARMNLRVPEIAATGINALELLAGKAYVAKSFRLQSPALEILINRDKPRNPNPPGARMPQSWLAEVQAPVQVESLEVVNGRIALTEVLAAHPEPGVLTFDAIQLSGKHITNQRDARSTILLTGQSLLMNRGLLKGSMELPVNASEWTFRYNASLGRMDLRALNSFLHVVGHCRIDSGIVQSASCDVNVRRGQCRGRFDGTYQGLDVTVLDRQTGEDSGMINWLKSAFVNNIALRSANPQKSGEAKVGLVDYTRQASDSFLPFVWFGIRSGMFDVLGLTPYVKKEHPK